jgi:hypothetical protein
VRALTDPSGAVKDTYDYDAFGNSFHSETLASQLYTTGGGKKYETQEGTRTTDV